ncbi:MAG: hypothetical protein GXO77_12365 [Calditrichaeota bacterium]|nr:hypothetical protein [Calditrichota bacterium]
MRLLQIIIISIIFSVKIFPQNVQSQVKQNGVDIAYRFSHLSLIDELISRRQYSGSVSGWEIKWITGNTSPITHVGFIYEQGDQIKNFSVTARVRNFTLYYNCLFLSARFRLFSKQCAVYFGPSMLIFYHQRKQDIGKTLPESSSLGLASINLYNRMALKLSSVLYLKGDFRLAILSFTGKTTDPLQGEEEPPNPRLLTALSVTDFYSIFSLQWMVYKNFALHLEYSFNMKRVTSWDYFRSLTDILSIKIGVRF